MTYICPICEDTLLCHLRKREIIWFCLRCHQEMPNFNLFEDRITTQNYQLSIELQNQLEKFSKPQKENNKNLLKPEKIHFINSVIDQGQKRLEIVSFILSQINYIVCCLVSDITQDLKAKRQMTLQKESKIQDNKFNSANFLKDSEIIVLYICQAILANDITVLSKQHLAELKTDCVESNNSLEQIIYCVCAIKNSVLDFVQSTAFKSSTSQSSPDYAWNAEIANYFDVALALII